MLLRSFFLKPQPRRVLTRSKVGESLLNSDDKHRVSENKKVIETISRFKTDEERWEEYRDKKMNRNDINDQKNCQSFIQR